MRPAAALYRLACVGIIARFPEGSRREGPYAHEKAQQTCEEGSAYIDDKEVCKRQDGKCTETDEACGQPGQGPYAGLEGRFQTRCADSGQERAQTEGPQDSACGARPGKRRRITRKRK